jgi:hypothetical protein
MSLFQLLAALFAFFMLYIVNIHKKKAALSALEVGFWYAVWFLFIIISLMPNLLLGIVNIIHFARVFDLLTVLAFIFLTVLIVITYFTQKENSKKIEQYIRTIAINKSINHPKSST